MGFYVHRKVDVFGISLQLACSPLLYYFVLSGLLNNHAKTQWAKIPNIVLCNVVFAVCTARRLLINLLTSELSLVKLRQWGESGKNRRFELPNMKRELDKPPPSIKRKKSYKLRTTKRSPLDSASHSPCKTALISRLSLQSPFKTLELHSESTSERNSYIF